jgi:hypothetical protein
MILKVTMIDDLSKSNHLHTLDILIQMTTYAILVLVSIFLSCFTCGPFPEHANQPLISLVLLCQKPSSLLLHLGLSHAPDKINFYACVR